MIEVSQEDGMKGQEDTLAMGSRGIGTLLMQR